ncbi:hypothetical protein FQR65_LT10256 [Abscondita terminalis]|nr:hypothetical protein FQR65_LT10256 [Abscondita terminalis]
MCERLDVECNKNFQVKYIPHKLLVGGGPPNCSPGVLHALSQPPLSAVCEELYLLIDEIQEMLRYVFQTTNKVTLGIQTSGTGGIEAALLNVVDPGETVIIGVCGYWGTRLVQIAKRANINVVEMKVEKAGTTFSLEELEKEIIKHKPVLLFLVHGESSLGVLQQLEGLGDICHKHNCLLGIDAIASLGCVPLYVDRWKIDIAVSSSNKALRGPPGIAYLTFNPRAVNRIRSIKVKPPFYYDLLKLFDVWKCFDQHSIYYYTYNSNLLYAAREGLTEIAEEGISASCDKHKRLGKQLWVGLENMGFEMMVKNPKDRLWTITCVHLPNNLTWSEINDYLSSRYKLLLGPGIGPDSSRVVRIGIMGYNAREEVVQFLLDKLREAILYYKK